MGGSSKGGGPSTPQLQNSEVKNTNALTALATQSQQQGNDLFNLAFPGLVTSENQASVLASGDPYAISRLIAPAVGNITQAAAGAKQNIITNAPAGGEKNLALESIDANTGAQVGALATQGFNNSFNSLAELGGRGIGLGQNATGQAASSLTSANASLSSLVNQNIEQKGASLGAFGALGGALGTAAGGFLGGPGFAALMA